jgi:hypothetical protein
MTDLSELLCSEQNEYTIDMLVKAKIRWLHPPKNTTEQIYRDQAQTKMDCEADSVGKKIEEILNKSDTEKRICQIVSELLFVINV